MYEVTEETIKKAYKPFDFVESEKGSLGYIKEVSINHCQEGFDNQVGYSVNWIKNVDNEHNAWWSHENLKVIGNMFKEIAKSSCHAFSDNDKYIDRLM